MTDPVLSTPTPAYDFLSGGGEMSERMRTFDWAITSIGPIQSWPQSLRTVLQLILNSRAPALLWWGPELIQFYNDAFRPMLGSSKHPTALGASGRQTWAEVWDLIEPMIDAVMKRGESTRVQDGLLVLERNGFADEGYFDYACSPIRDQSGRIAGVFAAWSETTQRVLANRRIEGLRTSAAESEARYRSALSAGRMVTWETDLVARNRSWSEEAIALFGFDPKLRIGTVGGVSDEYLLAIHPDDRHLVARFHQLADQQDMFDAEYRIVRPGGEVLWLAGRGKVVSRSADGKAHRLINIVADISERKNAERALRKSEELYRGTFENAAIGIAHVGLDGRWLRVNQAICQITGYEADELQRISFVDITYPDDVELDLSLVARLLAGEIINYSMEKRYLRKDGSLVWAHLTVSLLRDADGTPLHFISAIEDITRKKASEEELNRQRHFIERLTDLMPSVLYVFDLLEQRIIWVNRPISRNDSQRTVDDSVMNADFLSAVDPEDQELLADHFSRLAACQDGEVLECTYRVRRKDGQRRWLRSSDAPFARDSGGQVREIVGVATDVTNARQIEHSLRDADQKKDNFIATLAHELRNPLAPIRNAVDVMRRVATTDPQLNWCRDLIDRQVAQMAHLVEDLLDVSRITSGKLTLRIEHLEMRIVVEQAIEIARPYIEAAGHELIINMPAQPIVLDGDLTRLAQVFSNLLINAAKYTDGQGKISLRIEELQDAVVVRVADTGIGIAPEHLPKVFTMFGQVTSALARSQGGLGIGLSLIKGLVEMHGGQITAHSEGAGKGSQFAVRLPKLNVDLDSDTVQTSESGASNIKRAYRILIADDSRDSADSLAMLLQLGGHEVHISYDGESALQMAELHRPEVLLLDIGMPGFNGYQVSQQIRSKLWGKSVVLIAQTGWGQDRDRELSSAAGFDHHLVKPVDPASLENLLRSLTIPASNSAGQ
jgi:PAS domain S-box-containing protein